ncbi:hypothetical protein QFC20_007068 [Naganishia adeliensis]|uniref:Uncharacterized protein n=1 Tax=Naganishia adeliensis TaxID=92952 RepID=A0ACC2V3W2_9TREE|nr:hypothetical protein QFC20_007068 [Naganishia adeliensis]
MTAPSEPIALGDDAFIRQIMPIQNLKLTLPSKKGKIVNAKKPCSPAYCDSSPLPTPPATPCRPTPLHHPLARRLQYLTEIPPSPPVDLAPLKLLDTDGDPIVHPLQLAPEPVSPLPEGVEECRASSRSALSEKGAALGLDLGLGPVPALVAPAPRPPHAFIKRHASNASSGSPTTGSPIMSPAISPSPVSMAAKSPLATADTEQRESMAMLKLLQTM